MSEFHLFPKMSEDDVLSKEDEQDEEREEEGRDGEGVGRIRIEHLEETDNIEITR